MDKIPEIVISLYARGFSTKNIEKQGICSESKARKILINEGLYKSPRTVEIGLMLKEGMTALQIAEKLNISSKMVNAFMPYSKGLYLSENPTPNAMRIRRHRNK